MNMKEEIAKVQGKPSPVKRSGRKSNGKNSPVIGDNGVNCSPESASAIAGHLLTIHSWGKVDVSNVEALEERFWKYVQFCNDTGMKVTNQAVYFALGIDKTTATDWENGRTRTPAHSELIKKVRAFCASYREMLGAEGKLNPVTLVWWQKNYDGFVDRQEVVLEPRNPLGEAPSDQEIASHITGRLTD